LIQFASGIGEGTTGASTHALRDEGTSYHYLPPAESVAGDAALTAALEEELTGVGLPILAGTIWTTDAPYRETAEQVARHASRGILAGEMQAASLFAFGTARRVRCGVVAYVTNGVDHEAAEQFDKGSHDVGVAILTAMCRAGRCCVRHR
jgi:uridine phosphorylase